MSKSTISIRAPRRLVFDLRMKFPNLSDSELYRVMYDSSLLKVESNLRVKKK